MAWINATLKTLLTHLVQLETPQGVTLSVGVMALIEALGEHLGPDFVELYKTKAARQLRMPDVQQAETGLEEVRLMLAAL